jgi:hypothetical protein
VRDASDIGPLILRYAVRLTAASEPRRTGRFQLERVTPPAGTVNASKQKSWLMVEPLPRMKVAYMTGSALTSTHPPFLRERLTSI